METIFHNITITIEAKTSEEAYTKLCNALASIDAEWHTDTYSVVSETDIFGSNVERPTSELFPKK